MIKIFLTFLILCNAAYADSIFGEFYLEPIDYENKKLASEIENELLYSLAPEKFENAISGEDLLILNRVRKRGTRKDYLKTMNEFKLNDKVDMFFNIGIKENSDGLKQLSFNIANKKKRVIYHRESLYDYQSAAEYVNRITLWLEEFENLLPPVGEITDISEGKISMKLVHDTGVSNFKGRPFYIGDFKYDSDFTNDAYSRMGVVTESKNGQLRGYVYATYRTKNLNIGDKLIFLNHESKVVNNKEKIVVSETWFNYLNSPKFSLLDCSLLPVLGNLKSNQKLHIKLTKMVSKQKLCKFRDDKKLIKILSRYGSDLDNHLHDEVVLRNLTQILRVGALFRLSIHKVLNGTSIKFDVVAENGKSIYYSKYIVTEEYNEEYISELLYGWVVDYKRTLPLTGKIIQIRGGNLLIDIPSGLVEGTKQEFKVIRPISLRYEEVLGNRKITWKNKTIAYGSIKSINKRHSIGEIFKFADANAKVKEGDWIFIEDLSFQVKEDTYIIKKHNLKNSRNIGKAKITTEFTNIATAGDSATIYGLGVGLDFYLPYGMLFTAEGVKNIAGGDQSISNNNFTAAIGYSFTPRLYEYLTFVDLYLGTRTVNYALDSLNAKGIGDLKYSGFFAAVRTEIPLYKKFSLQAEFNYAPFDTVSNSNSLYGEIDESFAYGIKVIGKYKLSPTKRLYAEYHQTTYGSTYDGVDKVDVTLKANLIKFSYGVDF